MPVRALRRFADPAKFLIRQSRGVLHITWGTYQKRKNLQAELDLERRRELGMKLYSDTAEPVAISAASKCKVKRLPAVPLPDGGVGALEMFVGPCQIWNLRDTLPIVCRSLPPLAT